MPASAKALARAVSTAIALARTWPRVTLAKTAVASAKTPIAAMTMTMTNPASFARVDRNPWARDPTGSARRDRVGAVARAGLLGLMRRRKILAALLLRAFGCVRR